MASIQKSTFFRPHPIFPDFRQPSFEWFGFGRRDWLDNAEYALGISTVCFSVFSIRRHDFKGGTNCTPVGIKLRIALPHFFIYCLGSALSVKDSTTSENRKPPVILNSAQKNSKSIHNAPESAQSSVSYIPSSLSKQVPGICSRLIQEVSALFRRYCRRMLLGFAGILILKKPWASKRHVFATRVARLNRVRNRRVKKPRSYALPFEEPSRQSSVRHHDMFPKRI